MEDEDSIPAEVVEVVGRSDHAGAMPMDLRRDPMPGAAEMVSRAIENATRMGRPAVTTVGRVLVDPNFPAIVPETVSFTIDARHPAPATLARLCAEHEATVESVANRRGLRVNWRITQEHRIVYRVTEGRVDFLQARYHY